MQSIPPITIGCPKFDRGNYEEKIACIFTNNAVRSVTAVRMSVPCCAALERTVKEAIGKSGKDIPCETAVVEICGK